MVPDIGVNLLSRTYCLALSRPVRAGPTASAPTLGAQAVLPIHSRNETLCFACRGLMGINFAAFLGISLLVILSPGQDTALTIRNTLLGGRGGGIATAAGVVTGLATWTVASSAGLAALLVASQPLFLAVRVAGAAYLIFLGLQALYGAVRGDHRADAGRPVRGSRLRSAVAYRQG